MLEIKPFKAWTYSERDIGPLLSPPYDVITPEAHQQFLNLSPYQSVRLGLVDNPTDDSRYKKMAQTFKDWKQAGILVQVNDPAFYILEETYFDNGTEKIRVGFVGLVKTLDHDKRVILPHEHTLAGPKKDRFELLQTMGADISQIFLAYDDPELLIEKIYESKKVEQPLLDGIDSSKIRRRVWAISEKPLLDKIVKYFEKRKCLIADGHHRYETMLAARSMTPYAACYFTNLKNPSFSIRPIHRTFSLPSNFSEENFVTLLKSEFKTTEVSPEQFHQVKLCQNEVEFIVSLAQGKKHILLSRNKTSLDDAAIFSIHRDIFEKILQWDISQLAKGTVHYSNTVDEYLKSLNDIQRSVGLFLPPTDLSLVMRLAEQGIKMPQKSTFFYPKIASGLLIYDINQSF